MLDRDDDAGATQPNPYPLGMDEATGTTRDGTGVEAAGRTAHRMGQPMQSSPRTLRGALPDDRDALSERHTPVGRHVHGHDVRLA